MPVHRTITNMRFGFRQRSLKPPSNEDYLCRASIPKFSRYYREISLTPSQNVSMAAGLWLWCCVLENSGSKYGPLGVAWGKGPPSPTIRSMEYTPSPAPAGSFWPGTSDGFYCYCYLRSSLHYFYFSFHFS